MISCKEESLRWVHRYAAGGAVFSAVPLPLSTAPLLAALETHMFSVIANVYGDSIGAGTTAAAGGTFAAMGTGLKYAASEAIRFVPVIGPVIRGVIAAATIEAIGQAVIAHYERKFPGKMFTQPT